MCVCVCEGEKEKPMKEQDDQETSTTHVSGSRFNACWLYEKDPCWDLHICVTSVYTHTLVACGLLKTSFIITVLLYCSGITHPVELSVEALICQDCGCWMEGRSVTFACLVF
jgi:hypothetical protein